MHFRGFVMTNNKGFTLGNLTGFRRSSSAPCRTYFLCWFGGEARGGGKIRANCQNFIFPQFYSTFFVEVGRFLAVMSGYRLRLGGRCHLPLSMFLGRFWRESFGFLGSLLVGSENGQFLVRNWLRNGHSRSRGRISGFSEPAFPKIPKSGPVVRN